MESSRQHIMLIIIPSFDHKGLSLSNSFHLGWSRIALTYWAQSEVNEVVSLKEFYPTFSIPCQQPQMHH
jgi:hypothetical protein